MPSKRQIIFLAAILLTSCAAPTPTATVIPQTSEVSETSEVLTATPTSAPTSIPTSTQTPEPALPSYGVIDPNIGEKLQAEGIAIPEELKYPEYDLNFATEYFAVQWTEPYPGVKIPIGVVPEKGIADGNYHIKGIGAMQEAWNEYAKQHIKHMWIHYREYGDPADREITLEQYVELLKAGRGGFEIPQYNPETGFFDKKAMVNPKAGVVRIISDNDNKYLPLKVSDQSSMMIYVDENGMLWIAGNDLEHSIEPWLNPDDRSPYKKKTYEQAPNLAYSLLTSTAFIGINSNQCLATSNASAACLRDSSKIDNKYWDTSVGLAPIYKAWLAKYEAGDHSAKPPWWIIQD